jgi:hypothetical protein
LRSPSWVARVHALVRRSALPVGTLRRKLGDPPLIETVTGAGYRIAG